MAGLSVGMKCLQGLMVVFNLLVLIGSLGIIGIGSYVLAKFIEYGPGMQRMWLAAPIAVISLGSVVFLISFLGCCGAYKQNYCMLMTYATVLVIIFIAGFTFAILAIVYKNQVKAQLSDIFKKAIGDYEKNQEIASAIDLIQEKFECCGASGSADYPAGKVPSSCRATFYNTGCVEKLEPFMQSRLLLIAIFLFALIFVVLISIIVACVLGRQVHSYEAV